jgi:uncharacterized damage-inducible protein DinB
MPNKDYILMMARYNLWQNESLITAADSLSTSEREKDRGAFFGSIQKTFSHIYWGDLMWMSRFTALPAPEGGISESTSLIKSWEQFRDERKAFDKRILQWAYEVAPDWLEGDLSWFSVAIGRDVTKPKKMLVIQLFNHQTHHRGQIHAMLTSAGAKPDDTDIPFAPEHILSM